jgi:hypothetical protein
MLMGKHTRKRYRMGDRVDVKILSSTPVNRQIDLLPAHMEMPEVEEEKAPPERAPKRLKTPIGASGPTPASPGAATTGKGGAVRGRSQRGTATARSQASGRSAAAAAPEAPEAPASAGSRSRRSRRGRAAATPATPGAAAEAAPAAEPATTAATAKPAPAAATAKPAQAGTGPAHAPAAPAPAPARKRRRLVFGNTGSGG